MSSLDKYIVTVDYAIETFNQYVAAQRSDLLARGETSNDLLVNLFKAYLLVPDLTFTNYIQKKNDDYDDSDDKVTENSFMAKGYLKYKILVKEGKYNVPTKEEQNIISLSAEFDELKSKNAELTAQLNEKRQKIKKPKADAADVEKWAWKKVPPASGALSTKVVNTKTYHWCVKHAMWTIHTPADCNLAEPDTTVPPSSTTSPSKSVPTGQTARDLAAIQDQETGSIFQDE